jgi:hypothetical protein
VADMGPSDWMGMGWVGLGGWWGWAGGCECVSE